MDEIREKIRERKAAADAEAKRLLSLLSVDQVERIAREWRIQNKSPFSPRARYYIKSGTVALYAIRAGIIPRDIALFFADMGKKKGRS